MQVNGPKIRNKIKSQEENESMRKVKGGHGDLEIMEKMERKEANLGQVE
jgi:hypothetical protein